MTRSRVFLFLSLLAGVSSAANLSLQELRSQLTSRNASWTAGETSVSRLSEQEKKNLLGLQLDEGFGDFFKSAKPQVLNRALPSKFDWRNKDGQNYVGPVR